MTQEEKAKCLRKMMIGTIIAQYAMYELIDSTKQDLRQRVNRVIAATKQVESWFLNNPNCSAKTKETLRRQFGNNELYLLSELVETLWGVSEDDLEHLLSQLTENIEHERDAQTIQ
jgi:hypothetical protein